MEKYIALKIPLQSAVTEPQVSLHGQLLPSEGPAFSTDRFSLPASSAGDHGPAPDVHFEDEDTLKTPFIAEIESVTCCPMTNTVAVLDISGSVFFAFVVEQESGRLTLQFSSEAGMPVGGVGSLVSKLVMLPREIAQGGASSVMALTLGGSVVRVDAGGPAASAAAVGRFETGGSSGRSSSVPFVEEPGGGGSPEPWSSCSSRGAAVGGVKFHPLFSSLFLVSYGNGDLAVFDTTASSLPVLYFPQMSSSSHTAVAWSGVRPTVFFALTKTGLLQIFDLAANSEGPVEQLDLGSLPRAGEEQQEESSPFSGMPPGQSTLDSEESANFPVVDLASCPETGKLVALYCSAKSPSGGGGKVLVRILELSAAYAQPLSQYPQQKPVLQNNKFFDARNNLFEKNRGNLPMMKKMVENRAAKLEIDILHKVLLMS